MLASKPLTTKITVSFLVLLGVEVGATGWIATDFTSSSLKNCTIDLSWNLLFVKARCLIQMPHTWIWTRTIGRYPQLLADHPSPYDIHLLPRARHQSFYPSLEYITKDVVELREKWTAEVYYNSVGRVDLRPLEYQLGLPIGPSPQQAVELRAYSRGMVKENIAWFKFMQQAKPKTRIRDRFDVFFKEFPSYVPAIVPDSFTPPVLHSSSIDPPSLELHTHPGSSTL